MTEYKFRCTGCHTGCRIILEDNSSELPTKCAWDGSYAEWHEVDDVEAEQ